MKKLIVRTLTGAAFVVAVAGSIVWHPYAFLALFLVIVVLACWEFLACAGKTIAQPTKIVATLAAAFLYAASFFFACGYDRSGTLFQLYILLLIGLFIAGLYRKTDNPVQDWAALLLSQGYCAGLFAFLNLIAFDSEQRYQWQYVLIIFIFIWLNDTGAYLVGSAIGKHRLFPRISPLKSWEGFFGGMAVVVGTSLTAAAYWPEIFQSWYEWVLFAVVIVVFGTFGDLLESQLKRTYCIKDSGTLLPGHGGILDRFDSVMLAAPVAYIYLQIIRN